ncbi:MAG: helix-turn-helix domain-containing protein [Desulfobacteraceae bacterium]|nr:helix-turn-helix domain-containing protein [Desulfobacteraceae bacterium]
MINGYNEYGPPVRLQPYIDRYWSYATDSAAISLNRNRIIPDGCIDIIFDLSPSAALKSFVVGAMTKPMESDRTNLVGVRFNPGMAYPFFNVPMHEVTDRLVDYFEFAGRETTHLLNQLMDLNTTHRQIELLNKTFINKLSSINPIDPKMARALALIRKTQGRCSIKQTCDDIGWSRQHLARKTLTYTGITAKFLAQVTRVRHVIKRHGTNSFQNWSQLSVDVGYYDQSHMINEFRRITGQTPVEFVIKP